MHKKPSGFLPPSLELVSPHSQPFLPCKRSKKQRRSTETSLHPHHNYYSPNLLVYSLVMTRFTFALILVFLALTVAPAILAAPISVRRNIGFHKAPSGSESNVVIPELTLFEKMHLFSDDLTTTSSMVPQLKDGDYTVKALKKFAEKFGKFNTEKLEPALKANEKNWSCRGSEDAAGVH
ncbi:hypothetical protein FB446DRAFT_713029 [Lentinula raphanica]|nr:hypothetical protein FB446DRAFT_713029 [Lentinula raphanica]